MTHPAPHSRPNGGNTAPSRMFAAERRNHIARLIETHQRVIVADLAQRFRVSEATIRRDLALLDGIGVLQRTHGGAIATEQMSFEPDVKERQVLHLEEKVRIGQKAVGFIQDGDSVILDAGTTTVHIARALKGRRVTVVTNALNIADELLESPATKILVTGGMARSRTSSLVGPYADEVLPKMVAPANIRELPTVAEHVLAMMRAAPAEGAAAALRGRAERPDYVDMLARIEVPALVVVGSDDEFTPVSDAELMHERIPDATLVVVEGAAHMPNLEREAEFNDALQRFLDSLPP